MTEILVQLPDKMKIVRCGVVKCKHLIQQSQIVKKNKIYICELEYIELDKCGKCLKKVIDK